LKTLPKNKKKRAKALAKVKTKIILCTPIPAFKQSWNINETIIANEIIPIQQEVAQEYGLQVVDLHTLFANDEDKLLPDGIHPNDKGVSKMADIIAAALKGE
jgi:lysophospholipase L1-like esterase